MTLRLKSQGKLLFRMPFKPITHMCVNMYEHKNKEKEKQESIISE